MAFYGYLVSSSLGRSNIDVVLGTMIRTGVLRGSLESFSYFMIKYRDAAEGDLSCDSSP